MYPPVSQLCARIRPLDLGDSIGKAAELLRTSNGRAAPVIVSGHVLGLVTDADLGAALAADPARAKSLPVATLELHPISGIPDFWGADHALAHFRREGLEVAPVVDAIGRYVGMVSLADLATALCGRLRPKSIGGMATPFGVYLTDGAVRGGVGDWALMSAGMYIGLLHLAAVAVTFTLIGDGGWINHFPRALVWLHTLGPDHVRVAMLFLLFALGFRLSPISGFHAAEHQTVHAIEAGDDLRPDVVRTKPRVHPRCGTNLVVGLLLIGLLWNADSLRRWDQLGALAATILFLFTWRRLGSLAQQWITTRPANDEQIRSGIRAGDQLLEQYQANHAFGQNRWLRIWNIGICQVVSGFAALLALVALVNQFVFRIPGFEIFW
jgi:CBS domain-containing protein